MERINPTRIANRIGRIVFATILAGVFVGTLSLFNLNDMDSLTSLDSVLNIYVGALVEVAIMPVLVGFIVLPTILVYWALSNRVSWTRKWQILLTGTVAVAVAWAVGENSGVLDITLATLAKVIYGCAILAAISLTESLSGRDVTFAPRQIATGTGALALVFVVLVPAAAIGAGVVGDRPGSDGYNSAVDATEPHSDPVGYPSWKVKTGESGSAMYLAENASEDRPQVYQPYNVSETHSGPEYFDLRTYKINKSGEWTTVAGQYYLRLEGPADERVWDEQVINSGVIQPAEPNGDMPTSGWGSPDGVSGVVKMEGIESMWVYYDVVDKDGEVHRYMVYLERDDV